MKTIIVAIGLAIVLAACGGKLPETHFYQLAEPGETPEAGPGVPLVIETLATDSAYDDDRMVYRLTPYRLDYYNYHRWSSAPGTLIADYLERAFESSGRFGAVTRDSDTTDAPVVLGGRVVAIEEVDVSKTKWVARIVLELTLTDTASGEVLWTKQFEETEPMPKQHPEGLARALSVALERITDRAVPTVSVIAERTAKAHEAAKATSGRAARLRP